jgi:hypothetical protein
LARGRETEHLDVALVRTGEPEDGAEGGGLARTIWAEETGELASWDLEVETTQGLGLSVSLLEPGDLDRWGPI